VGAAHSAAATCGKYIAASLRDLQQAVSGSFLHFKAFEIKNVPMHRYSNDGMSVSNASNDIFERQLRSDFQPG
jgi:hypothetical protein